MLLWGSVDCDSKEFDVARSDTDPAVPVNRSRRISRRFIRERNASISDSMSSMLSFVVADSCCSEALPGADKFVCSDIYMSPCELCALPTCGFDAPTIPLATSFRTCQGLR